MCNAAVPTMQRAISRFLRAGGAPKRGRGLCSGDGVHGVVHGAVPSAMDRNGAATAQCIGFVSAC